ncbi:putative F-box/FBD/LRR-repeat protein At1g22000 [Eutrema salsugineum]|uniref:putative F-box/FBD/LRR-repeat protein At1g22000 n=1 Tax=Eutrema salsugineum TaxID=72664 RepID=UPI000CED4B85|nr:putative F-box/FBD/LRR-repeat protein At1g22000 [Eutrema salsugineum]
MRHLTLPETEACQRMENRICDLPDDLLVRILLFVPTTKEAVATAVLSKRWRHVWTMLHELVFKDEGSESVGSFIEKSLQLHKAPKLLRLIVELGPRSHVDVDVMKLIENAVNRGVELLDFMLLWNADPTRFPKSLYTCDTLVFLTLSNKILVDVSSPVRLPSLLYLRLFYVVYKDEDSLVRLLSSSPALENLAVERHKDDNLTNFTIKVSSLKTLYYTWADEDEDEDEDEEQEQEEDDDDLIGSLVIDSPALTKLDLMDVWEDCLIENMACLNDASIHSVHNPDDKFLRSLSCYIYLTQSMVACCNDIKFSRLIELYFWPDTSVDWLEPLMFLLQNSPNLKTLVINTVSTFLPLPPSWNQPNSVPGCLSSHLEIFGWRYYDGREDEKQLLTYILTNSKCLKTVEISLMEDPNLEERQKEVESMPRISTSCRLLFPTEMECRSNETVTSL